MRTSLTTIAVLGCLAIGAFFMVNVEMPSWAGYVSGLNVILFAIPSFWAARWWIGWRDAGLLFVTLAVLALTVETLAIITGFPYGHFGYSDLLGYRLLGYVPWTVALAWTPLVLGVYAISARLIPGDRLAIARVIFTAVLLMIFDVVLDPGAVRLGFWRYADGGEFYGVPLSNFVGWLFSGAIAAIVLEVFFWIRRPLLPPPAQLVVSTFFIIAFWMFIAMFAALYWSVIIGVIVLAMVAAFYAKYHYKFDNMIVYCDEAGTPIGTAPKLAAHDDDTKRHLAFSVFLFNGKGELLLQQRALSKKTWPGVWSNSCCGHIMLHESVKHAAGRRIKYELGITGVDLEIVLPDFRYRAEKDCVVENEICPVLVGYNSPEPRPNELEVASTRWVNWEQFVVEVADRANGYSPWAIEEVELLRDKIFRNK